MILTGRRNRVLHLLGTALLETGKIQPAEEIGTRLLNAAQSAAESDDPDPIGVNNPLHRDPLFHGHQLLGRVAIRRGNVREAGGHLLASLERKLSPTLLGFGPTMVLASELLIAGEPTDVVRYLHACEQVWLPGQARIRAWLDAIGAGTACQLRVPLDPVPLNERFEPPQSPH